MKFIATVAAVASLVSGISALTLVSPQTTYGQSLIWSRNQTQSVVYQTSLGLDSITRYVYAFVEPGHFPVWDCTRSFTGQNVPPHTTVTCYFSLDQVDPQKTLTPGTEGSVVLEDLTQAGALGFWTAQGTNIQFHVQN